MLSYVAMCLRLVIVAVLAGSALAKVWHRSALVQLGSTLQTGLRLPQGQLLASAWVVVEAITALALALPITARYAAVLAVPEFGCLTVGAALLVAQHRGFACHCFGITHAPLSWWSVLRNGTLMLAALLVAVAGWLPGSGSTPAPVLLAAALTVLVGAALALGAGPLRRLMARPRVVRPAISAGGRP